MGVVAEVERSLARQRCAGEDERPIALRSSTMTHIVWAPPRWLEPARATLAGLIERHPARTIFLVPERGKRPAVEASATLKHVEVDGLSDPVVSEVIEIRLRGSAADHPASVVLPLLISDLPVFCRWRGTPGWGSPALADVARLCDRLVVDSAEWRPVMAGFLELPRLFGRLAVSDIAFARSLAWRARIAERWPSVADVDRLRVQGPQADAVLVAGWLRSRLKRDIRLTRRDGEYLERMWLDGTELEPPPADEVGASELLSAELDRYGRDPVYEEAVRAATTSGSLSAGVRGRRD